MREGFKALAYMFLVGGFIFLMYEFYKMFYNGVNPFQ